MDPYSKDGKTLKKRNLMDAPAEPFCVDENCFAPEAICSQVLKATTNHKPFLLTDRRFGRFEKALAANPLSTNERVRALLAAPRPWG
nr:hypothetical protein [uncultured Pseudomonas sp.]